MDTQHFYNDLAGPNSNQIKQEQNALSAMVQTHPYDTLILTHIPIQNTDKWVPTRAPDYMVI